LAPWLELEFPEKVGPTELMIIAVSPVNLARLSGPTRFNPAYTELGILIQF